MKYRSADAAKRVPAYKGGSQTQAVAALGCASTVAAVSVDAKRVGIALIAVLPFGHECERGPLDFPEAGALLAFSCRDRPR